MSKVKPPRRVRKSEAKMRLERLRAEVREAEADLRIAVDPFEIGSADTRERRAPAVRDLIASAREPAKHLQEHARKGADDGTANVIAGWLLQRVHELGLALALEDRAPAMVEAIRKRLPVGKLDDAALALEALIACGWTAKDARNATEYASPSAVDLEEDSEALGRHVEVSAEDGRKTVRPKR